MHGHGGGVCLPWCQGGPRTSPPVHFSRFVFYFFLWHSGRGLHILNIDVCATRRKWCLTSPGRVRHKFTTLVLIVETVIARALEPLRFARPPGGEAREKCRVTIALVAFLCSWGLLQSPFCHSKHCMYHRAVLCVVEVDLGVVFFSPWFFPMLHYTRRIWSQVGSE